MESRPSTEEWTKKMWDTHTNTMECYSAIKNEILPFAARWMYWESITLTEISETERYCFCTKFILKKWSFEQEVCSGEVSPCCLRSGCPDADLNLRSWASAWFTLRFPVLSPQEFLPLTDQLEPWPRASVPLSCPEPSRSSLHLLFWHPSSMEKRNGHCVCERRGKNDVPSIVPVSVLSDQGFLTGQVPRSFVISWSLLRWRGMTLTTLYVFRKHCSLLNSFSSFPHFTLTTALKKRKVPVVLLWKRDPVIKLYHSPLPSDSDKVHMVLALPLVCLISPVHPPPLHSVSKLPTEIIVVCYKSHEFWCWTEGQTFTLPPYLPASVSLL